MIVGVPNETFPGERRVALVPDGLTYLTRAGLEILVESGAGDAAGLPDALFQEKGASITASREELFQKADVVFQVRALGANPDAGKADIPHLRKGQALIAFTEPLSSPAAAKEPAERGALVFAMELIPRITRAQSMDALSSMATIAGYKAALLAADTLPKLFPMMMTAAGTLSPARVFVIGAGVAGLQAISSCRRLGAVVQAYDIRPTVKEQVQSVGGRFVELDLTTEGAEGTGGYAKEQDEEFYRKQREMMMRVVAESDVVISTAAVPGKKAPVLLTAEMVKGMAPGSVVIDLAAERGGNCELTCPDETTIENGVTILGPTNLPSDVPIHASQMYGRNASTLLLHIVEDGKLKIDLEDEITRGTLVTHDGEIVHPAVREALGLPSSATSIRSES